ncbi:Fe/S biogenesis protein NfuA [Candidatus Arcanobacter lacustris]|uniref:Fe/S biogenesis protein NfuA n=1 Tax=Candidatus Arcanibacter lacustris TaxID=1607817 RepID=A0A0F5MPT3_9RICK|nr:Fe/S biogenesis protein NfuA [Candidatus Arcanobacter lacustris]
MYIQTQTTPNPNALKFLPGGEIKSGNPVSFNDKENCASSALAKLLLSIENVREVFYGSDFITITKNEDGNWDLMKPEILVTIMDYLVAGREVFIGDLNADSDVSNGEDSDIVTQIKEIIEHRVRPAVAADGGDIIFMSFEDGIVKVELRGSCAGCPSSTVTLKHGIENMLKHYVPEVLAVEEV